MTGPPRCPADAPGPRPPASFEKEISRDIRYERGLAVKAAVALAIVAAVLIAHVLLFG
jgi:hypothetical protein